MTNQKILGALLIMFIIGAGIYFTAMKFKQEVSQVSVSPSPSPSELGFLFNKTPQPSSAQSAQQAELPLAKTKKLSRFPGILKPELLENKKALIQTAKGIIQLQIYPEASMAASNFMVLAEWTFHKTYCSITC